MKKGRKKGRNSLPKYCVFEKMLAAQIVAMAIEDWRGLIKEKAWLDKWQHKLKNFTEIRQFFGSKWCELLMSFMEITPAEILQKLEQELEEAKKKDSAKNA